MQNMGMMDKNTYIFFLFFTLQRAIIYLIWLKKITTFFPQL